MRRPHRKLLPPPLNDRDEFGLPMLSLLTEVSETPEERAKRVKFVRRAAFHFYRRIVEHLGEEKCAKLFANFGRRREGRQRGSTNPERDGELLARHAHLVQQATSAAGRAAAPRKAAEAVYRDRGARFGNSADALEKRLRRLLSQGPGERATDAKRALEAARRRPLTEPWPGGDRN
jgi:hypothetical protein